MAAAQAPEAVTAYIGVGANLGDARCTVTGAIDALGRLRDTSVTRRSSLYRSTPIDAGGPDYVNAVVEVRTGLCAPEVLAALQAIEAAAGRTRPYRNAPRTLDLDLLLFGSGSISSTRLTVPHPRMNERAFVLLPLAEIAPHRVAAGSLAAIAITSQVIARMTPEAED